MKVISANYRDRNSEYKWLIRDENEPIEKARACKEVTATNVKFMESSGGEQGFGCHVVAVAHDANGTDFEEEQPRKLRFEHYRFVDADGFKVTWASTLKLTADGQILAD